MIIGIISFLLSSSVLASQFVELEVKGEVLGRDDISAISCINKSRCLIASDETNELQLVEIKGRTLKVFSKSIKLGNFKKENDIEALTNDGKFFYAVGSHGLSRKNAKYQKSRYHIFKIEIDQNGKVISILRSNLESILKKTKKIAPYFKKSLKKNGINIEGLAFFDERLYVGFRSPIIDGKAQILSFNSKDFWKKGFSETKLIGVDLKDDRGIRSLEIKNNNAYIIAGNNDNQRNETSELVISNLNFEKLSFNPVPYDDFKLEGFDFNQDFTIYVYDSLKDGFPILDK